MSIYVLPTVEGLPPRAVLFQDTVLAEAEVKFGDEEEPTVLAAVAGQMATWSNDLGTWAVDGGMPLPADVAEAITEHARSLGVDI